MQIWIPVLAVAFLGERMGAKEILGLAAVAVGTLMVQLRRAGAVSRLLGRSLEGRG
jgi:drug/metabolite transporter (DMT)-like permease